MDREEIVKSLFEKGVMATPEMIERIEREGMDAFLGKMKQTGSAVVQDGGEEAALSCRVDGPSVRTELTPDDVVKANAERFDKLRKMLLRKMDAVSISNLGRSGGKTSVVGMVRDRTPDGFVIEDETGEVAGRSGEKVDPDDVIGVRGWVREDILFAQEIVFPDVPINRPVNGLEKTMLLTGNGSAGEKADLVLSPRKLVCGDVTEKEMPNPSRISVTSGDRSLTVVVYEPGREVDREEVRTWLKKRHFGCGGPVSPGTGMVLETVPDVFWVVSPGGPWTENYKGVSIVSLNDGSSALVDLRTRKVEMK